jgi:hypothetical protein
MAFKGKIRLGAPVVITMLALFLMALPFRAHAQTGRGLVTIGMQRVFEEVSPPSRPPLAKASMSISRPHPTSPNELRAGNGQTSSSRRGRGSMRW